MFVLAAECFVWNAMKLGYVLDNVGAKITGYLVEDNIRSLFNEFEFLVIHDRHILWSGYFTVHDSPTIVFIF